MDRTDTFQRGRRRRRAARRADLDLTAGTGAGREDARGRGYALHFLLISIHEVEITLRAEGDLLWSHRNLGLELPFSGERTSTDDRRDVAGRQCAKGNGLEEDRCLGHTASVLHGDNGASTLGTGCCERNLSGVSKRDVDHFPGHHDNGLGSEVFPDDADLGASLVRKRGRRDAVDFGLSVDDPTRGRLPVRHDDPTPLGYEDAGWPGKRVGLRGRHHVAVR